jgi:hypothetical protein
MPTAGNEDLLGELLGIMGEAGDGKSTLAMQSPQPHAVFCLDKAVIATLPKDFPNYDRNQTFYTPYFPPDVDLTKDDADRDRAIMDKLNKDLMQLLVGIREGKPTFKMNNEIWPLPKSTVIEGGDFLRKHLINQYLRRHSKHDMSDFDKETLLRWGSIGDEFFTLLQAITKLPAIRPVNVILTIGVKVEEQMKKNDFGKLELTKTGKIDPAFGGKMAQEAPRMFKDFWLAERLAGKFWIVTQQDLKHANYRGLRSGRFDLQPVEDVTLTNQKVVVNSLTKKQEIETVPYINQWNRLFKKGDLINEIRVPIVSS